jgi:UDP-2,3-diacylglucosamine hydrolase
VLVGDVFDQYIEYRHLVPKGQLRFLGLLADWSDRGIPILYLVGNRDPWHLDYFRQELGLGVERGPVRREIEGWHTYIAHGDGLTLRNPLFSRLRLLLRSPFMARLYRMSLPGDAGYAFARWFARRFGSDGTAEARTHDAFLNHARTLTAAPGTDLVVLGHSHRAACISLPDGTYLNPGYWFADRTFATLDAHGPALHRWTHGQAEPVAQERSAALAL